MSAMSVLSNLKTNWKAGLTVSVVAVLVKRYQGVGAILSISFIAILQYVKLKIEGSGGVTARLVLCDQSKVTDPVRRAMADRMAQIIKACPTLSQPAYVPPFWAANTWTNVVLLLIKLRIVKFLNPITFTKHVLKMKDGGEISIEVCSDPGIPDTAPIVIILPTITGTTRDAGIFVGEARRRGWRGCVFTRRGHRGPLASPSFNLLGDIEDTIAQVELVRSLYPNSFLGMAGLSAGSGLLVNYLGNVGSNTPVQATCCLCPAYDISVAFKNMRENFPLADQFILKGVKRTFIYPNSEILSLKSSEAVEGCVNATSIDDFMRSHAIFAGTSSAEEYLAKYNPMVWVDKVRVPLLVVNSEDDMVCLSQNIREDLFKILGGAALLRTKWGSHIAYNEGVLGSGNYLARVSMDFLESARLVSEAPLSGGGRALSGGDARQI